ncbi:MAG: protein kinase [Planctomycetes bacterium]|nr:protein kinase [Planctomycetota bacterium]
MRTGGTDATRVAVTAGRSEQDHEGATAAGPRDYAHSVAGRFELLQELGSGSSGTVYHARLLADYAEHPAGTEVAVKFLRRELVADERAHARLLAEGMLGRQLRHPNVAEIYGFETIDLLGMQTTYLVMQYVHGTTLREFLARSGAPVEDLTRRIGADAARGLSALHRRGLVHRDVKPENLILTPDSQLKIVDLGLVRPFGAIGGGSSGGSSPGRSSGLGLAGSVAYAAPEVLRGLPAGPRSDLYSLGVVLYEVTTGRHPFADALTTDEMLDAHLRRRPIPPSHLRTRISPLLEQVLGDLLQKEPDDRLRDAAELARILDQGEHSEYWRRHETRAPALASSRRLLRMRRPAEAPFVGRAHERQRLDAMLTQARGGRGGLVVVTGPDGIGRRRLLDESMQAWLETDEPPLYLGGDADSALGHGEPFARSLLDLLLRGDDRDSPNAMQRAIAGARSQFAADDGEAEALAAVAFGHSTEPPEVRADRLASALLSLPRPGRVLVVRVDHAERLDTSGRLILQRLAGRRHGLPLLLLLAAGVDGAAVEPDLRLDLTGLEEHEFLAFGRTLFRVGEDVDEFLRQAHQVLSGLPGNLLEALDHLVQEGLLAGRAGDYHHLDPATEPRPAPGHVQRFHRRVASLEPQQRRVLSAAAVLGARCPLGLLAALVGLPELAVLETLSLFRGRIVRAQGGEVSFRHRDFQLALLRDLPPADRERLHRAAAELLAARGGRRLEVGMHLSMALQHEAALDPLLDALDERVRAGSRRTSLRLVGRLQVHFAQVAPTPANERRRLRFLLLSGRARTAVGQPEAAGRAFRDAERLAQQQHDLEASAEARTGLANSELDLGRLVAAISLLESVHDDLAGSTGDAADVLAAQAHGLHGRILFYRGQAADGLRQLHAALKRVPPTEVELRCHLLIDLARVEALSHHYATAQRTLQKVEQAPGADRLPRVRLRLHLYRGQVRTLLGEDDAANDLRVAIDEADRLSLPVFGARAALFLAERLFWRRRDDQARTLLQLAVGLARSGEDRLGQAMARSYLLRLGEADDSLGALVEELDLPELRANWLLALAALGRPPADAAAQLEELLRDFDLPLSLHLRTLAWMARPASARALVRSIAERLPSRGGRRRFLAEWDRDARI